MLPILAALACKEDEKGEFRKFMAKYPERVHFPPSFLDVWQHLMSCCCMLISLCPLLASLQTFVHADLLTGSWWQEFDATPAHAKRITIAVIWILGLNLANRFSSRSPWEAETPNNFLTTPGSDYGFQGFFPIGLVFSELASMFPQDTAYPVITALCEALVCNWASEPWGCTWPKQLEEVLFDYIVRF